MSIDEKQKAFQKHLAGTRIKPDFDAIETEEFPGANSNSPIDSKSNELREPEIDMTDIQTNVFADELEFEATEMKDEEIRVDEGSMPTPSPPDEESTIFVKQM